MRKVLMGAVVLTAMSVMGCKKSVPDDIVQKTLKSALSLHAPATTSAMCGVPVKGLVSSSITIKTRNPDNTGVAHVRGSPWVTANAPAYCEGDVQYKFTFTQKTTGYKRKTTTTTWWLDNVKLVAIQTPGVKNTTAEENPDPNDDTP